MTEPDLRRWLDDHSHGLETVRPGAGSADLGAWRASLAGTRLLGVGEAVVGTRELVMLTHRLLEALVVDAGVRVVALGAPEAATVVVDEAVARGHDLGPALESVAHWRWTTGDVRAALTWLAEHNAGVGATDRVRVVGVDPVTPAPAGRAVGLHLRSADPDLLDAVGTGLHDLVTHHDDDPALPASVAEDAVRVRARLERDGVAEPLRRHGEALVRAAALATAAPSERAAVRERLVVEALAGEVEAAGEPGDGPAVVWWGHLREVRVRLDDGVPSVGARLRERYARGYYALGLLPGEGEFRARRRRRVRRVTRHPVLHRLGAPPSDSVEATLASTRLLDLRAGADRDGVPEWVGAATRMRVFDDPTPVGWKRVLEPSRPEEFDGLAHVARVHQAAVR